MTRVRRYLNPNEGFKIWRDITAWCFTHFGIPGDYQEDWNWSYNAESDWMDFYFKDPKAAELFILKWM